jgi:hypothetical protein
MVGSLNEDIENSEIRERCPVLTSVVVGIGDMGRTASRMGDGDGLFGFGPPVVLVVSCWRTPMGFLSSILGPEPAEGAGTALLLSLLLPCTCFLYVCTS